MKFTSFKSWRLMGVLALSATVLAACGNPEPATPAPGGDASGTGESTVNREGWPIVDEPITMNMMGPGTGIAPWEEMPFFIELGEKTNVNWTFTNPPMDDFQTNLNLALAAHNLPDVIIGAGSSGLSNAVLIEHGSQGTFIPLQDLIADYAPNLYALLEANPHIREAITAPDGNIYALPTINESVQASWPVGPFYWNGQWLDELGITELPQTLEEFNEVLLRFRDEDPTGEGLQRWGIGSGSGFMWERLYLMSMFGLLGRHQQVNDGVVVHNATTDAYRAFLDWANWAYNEGIFHPEIFTMAGEQMSALGQNNQIGLFQSWFSFQFLGTDYAQGLTNPFWGPIESAYSPAGGVIPRAAGLSFGTFAITSAAENPAAAIRWVDWFYSPEGMHFANYGPEGHFYVRDTNDAGEEVLIFGPAVTDDNRETARGAVTPFFGMPMPGRLVPLQDVLEDANTPRDTAFDEFLDAESERVFVRHGAMAMPPVMLTAEEVDEIVHMNADIAGFLDREEASFITQSGPITDEQWEAFQAELQARGVETVIRIWQQAYDRVR